MASENCRLKQTELIFSAIRILHSQLSIKPAGRPEGRPADEGSNQSSITSGVLFWLLPRRPE
jgi:hypothetical protein